MKLVLAALVALAGCASLDRIALPQSVPACAAYGASLTLTWPRGRLGRSAGCIEAAPYPGEPMPPRSLS